MRLLNAAAVMLLTAGASSCSEANLLTAPSSAARVEGTWNLVQITHPGLLLNEAKTAGRFALTLAGDRALLKADCNTCAGDFSLADDVISIRLQACTKAFCQSSPLDTQVGAALEGAHSVRLDSSRLQFTSTRGEVKFER